MRIVCGNRYWCIKPSMETEAAEEQYGEPALPQKPWLGQLYAVKVPAGIVYRLSRISRDGTIDDDPNATAIIDWPEHQLFTYEEALRKYCDWQASEIRRLREALEQKEERADK